MTLSIVGTETAGYDATTPTSQTVDIPSGAVAGDLLLVFISAKSAITPPSGWTLVGEKIESFSGAGRVSLYYRTRQSGDGANVTFTQASAAPFLLACTAVRGTYPTPLLLYSQETNSYYVSISYSTPLVHAGLVFLGTQWTSIIASAGSPTFMSYTDRTGEASSSYNRLAVGSMVKSAGNTSYGGVYRRIGDGQAAAIVVSVYEGDAPPVTTVDKELVLDWALEAPPVSKELVLDWSLISTIAKELVLDWRLIDYVSVETTLKWVLVDESTQPSVYWDITMQRVSKYKQPSASASPSIIPTEMTFVIPASQVAPEPVVLPDDEVGAMERDFFGDYYFRIWVDPILRRLTNPKLNSDLTFGVWNAYTESNDLTDVDYDDLTGVEVQFDTPLTFEALEYKLLNYQLTDEAPVELDGYINLTFEYGEGAFRLIANVIDIMPVLSNDPVIETWNWRTNVQASYRNYERRTAYRIEPRVSMSFTVQVTDEGYRQRVYTKLWNFVARGCQYPFWQYATPVAAAATGDFDLFFDPALTDLRDDEYAALYDPLNEELHLIKIDTVNTDGVTLSAAVQYPVSEGWLIIPTQSMSIPDGTSMRMRAVEGDIQFVASSLEYRELRRADADVTLTTYDSLYMIDKKPIAADDIEEGFSGGGETLDNETGKPLIYSAFTNTFVTTSNQWFVDRETDMDWWRELAWQLRGQQKKFLLPTWRDDLPLAEVPTLGSSVIVCEDTSIVDKVEFDTYKRIQIESANGIIQRKINTAEVNNDGYAELTLDDTIGDTAGDNDIGRISYINLVCLDDDAVSWRHSRNYSIVSLNTRTILE